MLFQAKKSRLAAVAIISALFLAWPIGNSVRVYLRNRAHEERQLEVAARFKQHCDSDARITIKKVVENVDGVFIMKPRTPAPNDFDNQFWMGDPYGYDTLEVDHIDRLLRDATTDGNGHKLAHPIAGFLYIEMKNPGPGPAFKVISWDGSRDVHNRPILTQTYSDQRRSRYGFDWDDISTSADRQMWIAGGRTRVIDLADNSVLAERIGYLVDPMQGGRVGGEAWVNSDNTACPPFENNRQKTQEFLGKVLKSSKEIKNGK
jgi:hypothetical protein